ncbi:hypothetical protein ACU6VJ_19845 (plasmid) [Sphaerotilus sulfidivorans]
MNNTIWGELLAALRPWWPDWAAFVAMGRHGGVVWPAVAICAAALALEQLALAHRARRAHRHDDTNDLHDAEDLR